MILIQLFIVGDVMLVVMVRCNTLCSCWESRIGSDGRQQYSL